MYRPCHLAAGLGVLLLVGGCHRQNGSVTNTSLAQPDSIASVENQDTSETSGQTSPIEDYRRARYQDAVRGVSFDSGFVEFTEEADAVKAETPPTDLDELLQQVAALLEQNRNTQAIKVSVAAVLQYPESPAAYDQLGQAMLLKRKASEALAAYKTALRLDPSLVDTRYRMGLVLMMQAQLPDALAAWEQVLEQDPDYRLAHQRLAIGYYYLHDYATSWRHVHAAEAQGLQLPPQFKNLLQDKMPEPAQ